MHLFCIGINIDWNDAPRIEQAFSQTATAFPQLDPATTQTTSAANGRFFLASMQINGRVVQPKQYLHSDQSQCVFYSGLPVDLSDSFAAHRATELAAHWKQAMHSLEGHYTIGRLDRHAATFELKTDLLGMEQLYSYKKGNQQYISNSVQLLERLMPTHVLDPLGVSLYLNFGWCSGDRTLTKGIRALPGGTLWRWQLDTGSVQEKKYAPIARLARGEKRPLTPTDITQLAEKLQSYTSQVVTHFPHVEAPLTAGRDSRFIAALLLEQASNVRFYTEGNAKSVDMRVGKQIAELYELSHTAKGVASQYIDDRFHSAKRRLIRQNDGLSNIRQLVHILDHQDDIEQLRTMFWGVGGEMCRGYFGTPQFYLQAQTLHSVTKHLQTHLINQSSGLLTSESVALAKQHLLQYVEQAVAQGFKHKDIPDIFYLNNRVARWGGHTIQRVRMAADVCSPFCTSPFVEATFALEAQQRYTEPLHYALVQLLAPALHRLPFDKGKWRTQISNKNLLKQLFQSKVAQARRKKPQLRKRNRTKQSASRISTNRRIFDLCRRDLQVRFREWSDSPLWEFVDRAKFAKIIDAPRYAPTHRELNVLLSVSTLLYHDLYRENDQAINVRSKVQQNTQGV